MSNLAQRVRCNPDSSTVSSVATTVDTNPLLPLTVSNVSFSASSRKLLDQVTLHLSGNGITALLGHNGAGKSLLLRVLHGLVQPDNGSIEWNEHLVDAQLRQRQAMVFQKPVVLRRSVAANIDYVLSLRKTPSHTRRDQLLSAANLLHKADQRATSLSGGEQQRLSIARALATEPGVLFLDEPTSSMDPAATGAIEQQIRDTSGQGIKIIMVTHDIAQARRLADDLVFLHRGAVTDHKRSDDFFAGGCSHQAQSYLDGQL
jgi:tungstate transport system ATP-binding protein